MMGNKQRLSHNSLEPQLVLFIFQFFVHFWYLVPKMSLNLRFPSSSKPWKTSSVQMDTDVHMLLILWTFDTLILRPKIAGAELEFSCHPLTLDHTPHVRDALKHVPVPLRGGGVSSWGCPFIWIYSSWAVVESGCVGCFSPCVPNPAGRGGSVRRQYPSPRPVFNILNDSTQLVQAFSLAACTHTHTDGRLLCSQPTTWTCTYWTTGSGSPAYPRMGWWISHTPWLNWYSSGTGHGKKTRWSGSDGVCRSCVCVCVFVWAW